MAACTVGDRGPLYQTIKVSYSIVAAGTVGVRGPLYLWPSLRIGLISVIRSIAVQQSSWFLYTFMGVPLWTKGQWELDSGSWRPTVSKRLRFPIV